MHWCATKPSRIVLATLSTLILSHSAFGAGRVDEFLTVKNWYGKITITGKGSGSTNGAFSDVWDYGILTMMTSLPGDVPGDGHVNDGRIPAERQRLRLFRCVHRDCL